MFTPLWVPYDLPSVTARFMLSRRGNWQGSFTVSHHLVKLDRISCESWSSFVCVQYSSLISKLSLDTRLEEGNLEEGPIHSSLFEMVCMILSIYIERASCGSIVERLLSELVAGCRCEVSPH